jgi:HEAT repeat protein
LPEIGTDQVARLIDELQSLHDAESAALKLITCGPVAIRPLRDFLLSGKPSNVFQSRYLAVKVLARLGAKEVLVEFLKSEREIADPEVRLGEEAVKEIAARELASWRTGDIFALLLDLISRRPLAGFIEAIGEFRRPEAVAYLIDALADDVCRTAAEEALKNVYGFARPLLIAAVSTPLPDVTHESPSSIRRRRSAVRLLAERGIAGTEWPALAPLLDEEDPTILTAISSIGVAIASPEEKEKITRRMLELLPGAEWSLQGDVESVLVRCFDECKSRIDQEVSFRRSSSGTNPVWDPVLMALLRIKRKAEEQNHEQ